MTTATPHPAGAANWQCRPALPATLSPLSGERGKAAGVKEEYIAGGQVQYTRYLLGGGMYEFTDDGPDVTYRQYYSVGGTKVAMKEWVNEGSRTTNFFASDHLSSTSLVMDSSGKKVPPLRLERRFSAPEADALSTELRGLVLPASILS